MSRRRAAEKRVVIPDHKYKDIILTKFMNRIMVDGKKSTSEKILEQVYGNWKELFHFELEGYQVFLLLAKQFGCYPADLFMTNDTLCVDEKGFRNSINSIIQGNGSGRVIKCQEIGFPKTLSKSPRIFLTVLNGYSNHG